MKLSMLGTGYVGLITGTCFAEMGNEVICVDKIQAKVDMINRAQAPIHEEGLPRLLRRHVDVSKQLRATTNTEEAILNSDITFICVGTPSNKDGSIDLGYIKSASEEIGKALAKKESFHIIVMKSTVVPGTTEEIVLKAIEKASGKKAGKDFGLAMCPEFLKEGVAVYDFMNPDRIVIGAYDELSAKTIESLFESFTCPKMLTDLRTAEMIKYASNSFSAMKISYINEIANICEHLKMDINEVARGLGMDARVSKHFLFAGVGWGGSCLKGDALVHTEKGMIPIMDIKEGDKVYSHDGRLHKVTETYKRINKKGVLCVSSRGMPSFSLTEEHPVLCVPSNRKCYQSGENKGKLMNNKNENWTHKWVPAKDLRRGDYLVFPIFPDTKNEELWMDLKPYITGRENKRVPDQVYITGDLLRLFGYYISEGSVDNKRITLSFNTTTKKDFVIDSEVIVRKYFGIESRPHSNSRHCRSVRIGALPITKFFEKSFGRGAANKHIPEPFMLLPVKLQRELLKGMWRGDGSKSTGIWTWATISRQLWNQMKILLLRQGIAASYTIHKGYKKDGVNHRQSYFVTISVKEDIDKMNKLMGDYTIQKDVKHHNTKWIKNGKVYYPVHTVKRIPHKGFVYNLEVEKTHSYLCEGAALHNCFPKDLKAITAASKAHRYTPLILEAVQRVNQNQRLHLISKIGNAKGKHVAVVGLAFKPGTDDVREAPSLTIIEHLLKQGAKVIGCDPIAIPNTKKVFGNKMRYTEDIKKCIKGADICVILTEWNEFRLDPSVFKKLMRGNRIIDGRRILDPVKCKKLGLDYFGIGYGR